MKIITPGHKYELESFEGSEPQTIQFIEKTSPHDGSGSTELYTVNDGTTNEEVLKVLIDRMKFLHAKVPSRESLFVIQKLEESLMWLEHRTKERIARGVEGTRRQ